jgi:type 1 glutamine amidotransferase
LRGIEREAFVAGGSLYQVSPLNPKAEVLLTGSVAGHPAEPIAWTFIRADGGRSFYTSLGAPADFEHPAFRQLLHNALLWGVGAEGSASE